jgi:hypothetical protein
MPTLKPPNTTREDAKGFMQIPNFFVSALMPKLKDTEFRLLVVVFQATLGFRAEYGASRKRRALPAHTLLIERTGRSKQAVTEAVDTLIRRNLLSVSLEDETLVLGASERRRARAKLYYSLSPTLLTRIDEAVPKLSTGGTSPFQDFSNRKVGITKQKRLLNSSNKEAYLSVSRSNAQSLRISGWNRVGSMTEPPTYLLGSGKEGT